MGEGRGKDPRRPQRQLAITAPRVTSPSCISGGEKKHNYYYY